VDKIGDFGFGIKAKLLVLLLRLQFCFGRCKKVTRILKLFVTSCLWRYAIWNCWFFIG